MAGLPDGGFIGVWASSSQDGTYNIYQRRFSAAGAASTTTDVLVNTYTTNRQSLPVVTVLADGGWVVAWESDNQDGSYAGVYARRYSSTGTALGGEFRVATTVYDRQYRVGLAATSDGGFVATWQSNTQDDGANNQGLASDTQAHQTVNREHIAAIATASIFEHLKEAGDACFAEQAEHPQPLIQPK